MSFQLHAPSATDRARSHSDPSPTLHPAVVTTSPPPPHLVPLPPSFSPEQHLIDEHQQHRDITVAQLSLVELAKRLNMPVASLVHSMQRTQRQRSANFGATATIPSNNSSSSSPTQPLLFGSTPPNPLTPPQNVVRHLNGDGSLLPPPSPANVFDAGRQQAASFRRSHSIDDGRHQHHISVSYPSHNSMWNVLQNETNGLNLVQRSPEIRLSASIEHHTLRWLGGADGEDGGHGEDGDAFLNAMLVPEHTAVIVRERGSNTMRVAVRGSRHYPHHQHREEDSNNDDDRRSRLSASSIQHNDDGEDEIAVGPRPTLTTNSLFSRRKVRFAPEIESIAFIDESEDARNARRSAMRNSRESAGTASGNDAGGGALFPLSNEDEHFLHAPMKSTSFVLKIQLGVPAPLWILFILCCCAFGALPFAVHKLVDATDGSHSAMVISLWQSEVMLFLAVVGMLLLVSIYQFISPKYLFSFTGLWKSAAAGMLFCVTFWTRDYAVANGCAPTLVSAGWGLVPLMQLLLRVLSRAGDDDDDDDDDSYGDYRRHRRRHSNVLLLRFEVYAAVASLVGTVAVVINEQTWYSPTLSPPSLLCGLAPCITVTLLLRVLKSLSYRSPTPMMVTLILLFVLFFNSVAVIINVKTLGPAFTGWGSKSITPVVVAASALGLFGVFSLCVSVIFLDPFTLSLCLAGHVVVVRCVGSATMSENDDFAQQTLELCLFLFGLILLGSGTALGAILSSRQRSQIHLRLEPRS